VPRPAKVDGFWPETLPPIKIGIDNVSPEGDLADGAVRDAVNVMLHDSGAFDRRPGFGALLNLPGAHSLWKGKNGAYVAAEGVVYAFDGSVTSVCPMPDDPVEYCDVGADVYFTAGGILRKRVGGTIYKPGLMDLTGFAPTLTATSGSMVSGTYAIAYSLVNALGEESGLSSPAFSYGTGFLLSGIASAPDAVAMKIYASAPNGEELFLHRDLPWAATASVVDRYRGPPAKRFLLAMPGGDYVREYRGRLWVAKDNWLFYSQALDYGRTDVRTGWIAFKKSIALLEAVENGLFIGFADGVHFLSGTGPADFKVVQVAEHGAKAHTGMIVPADVFAQEAPSGGRVAVWLSPKGFAVGTGDGATSFPQAARIELQANEGRTAFLQFQGIRQLLCLVDSLVLPTPDDATDMNIDTIGHDALRGHGIAAFAGARTVDGSFSAAGSAGLAGDGAELAEGTLTAAGTAALEAST
jgi:hypothetical protein